MNTKQFIKENPEYIINVIIITLITQLLINNKIEFNKQLLALLITATTLSTITQTIIRYKKNKQEITKNYKKNQIIIILLTISTLLIIAPKTNLFALPFLAIPAAGAISTVVTALGGTAVAGTIGAILLGLPALIATITLAATLFLFGGSLSTILSTIAGNFTTILIVAGGLTLLYIIRK